MTPKDPAPKDKAQHQQAAEDYLRRVFEGDEQRPDGLAWGQWIGDLMDMGQGYEASFGLYPAEVMLIKAAAVGEDCILGDGKLPEKDCEDEARYLRGGLIACLAQNLNVKMKLHPRGLQLDGASVKGNLDLEGVACDQDLYLDKSRFEEMPNLRSASLKVLSFEGSLLPGLKADRLKAQGSVFLRGGFECQGELRLLGGEIGSNLECDGAKLSNEGREAFNGDRLKVAGSVFLRGGFECQGKLNLLGAEIGRNLECTGAKLSNEGGYAFCGDSLKVDGDVFLRGGAVIKGHLSLLQAELQGSLLLQDSRFEGGPLDFEGMVCKGKIIFGGPRFGKASEVKSDMHFTDASIHEFWNVTHAWKQAGEIRMDGLSVERWGGDTDTSFEGMMAWLDKQPLEHKTIDFRPQPWQAAITTLKNQGHADTARQLAQELAKRQADAVTKHKTSSQWMKRVRQLFVHGIWGGVAGWGFDAWRVARWLAGSWALGAFIYALFFHAGMIGPTDTLITSVDGFTQICKNGWAGCELPASTAKRPMPWPPSEYTSFFALVYSLDVIIPILSLGQEVDWAPMRTSSGWFVSLAEGFLFVWYYVQMITGWMLSGLLIALATRAVQRD